MKKLFKYLLVVLIVPVAFMFMGCNDVGKSIVSIDKTDSVGIVDTYTITYNDGSTSSFVVTNGKDGQEIYQDITLDDLYEAVKARKGLGDEYTMADFVYEYLNLSVDSGEVASSTALRSAVSIFAEHEIQIVDYNNITHYTGGFAGVQENYGVKKSITHSAGAGVIYSLDKQQGDAYIITNYHVCYSADSIASDGISSNIVCYIYGAESISYKDLSNLTEYNKNCRDYKDCFKYDAEGLPIIDYGYGAIVASYVGGSREYDIAVLKVSGSEVLKQSDAKQVDIEDSNTVGVGATAIAVGNPNAYGLSVSSGIVSMDSEYISLKIGNSTVTLREFRIDTPVNSGNSGGGLFDNKGRLIGIVNAKTSSTEIENTNYAIPTNVAIGVAKNIIDNCDGISRTISVLDTAMTINVEGSKAVYDKDTGLYITQAEIVVESLIAEGVANNMGLKKGDILNSITIVRGEENEALYGTVSEIDTQITREYILEDFLLNVRVGDVIQIKYTRGGVAGVATSTILTAEDFVEVA